MKGTYKSKIVLLGDNKVGKTSLVRRYVDQTFSDSYKATIGANIKKKVMNYDDRGVILKMLIVDLIGQQGFRNTQRRNMKDATGALIVCDLTRQNTLESIGSYWIPLLKEVLGDAPPMIFMANKSDLVDMDDEKLKSYRSNLLSLSERFGTKFFFTSAKTGDNVEQSFYDIGLLSLNQEPAVYHWGELYHAEEGISPVEVLDLFKAQLYLELGGEEFVNSILQTQLPKIGIDINKKPTHKQLYKLNERIKEVELTFLGEKGASKYYRKRKGILAKLNDG